MVMLKEIERVVKSAGAGKLSSDALKELQNSLDKIGAELAKEAAALAKSEKRKTVSAQDVLRASGKA